jgi:8-oxo-dGTP pyrophosphatase MutT (NUDIX family)
MIRRKDTLGYIDFMRGKYSTQNTKYVLNMLKQMTQNEKNRILSLSFDELWTDLWGNNNPNEQNDKGSPKSISPYYESFRQEEINSRDKFNYLSTTMNPTTNPTMNSTTNYTTLLQYLIHESQTDDSPTWQEPEWGFPKGRRNYQERDYECALREMAEETGYSINDVKNIKNILPFEEYFIGSNYKSYKHKYYLMYMDYEKSLELHRFAKDEVSSMDWKTYEECIDCIRPYNLEKKRLISNIETALKKYIIQ